jgi:hypothetical protein
MPSVEIIDRLEGQFSAAREEAQRFFASIPPHAMDLPPELTKRAREVSALFSAPFVRLVSMVRESPMMGGVDTSAMQRALRTIDAAIRLREYYEWETEVLHDEGTVLGVKAAGASEGRRLTPKKASAEISSALDQVSRRMGILRAQAEAEAAGQVASLSPALALSSASVQPGTAFIIMMIDPERPELEDVKHTIQEECARFGIRATRSDEIEHSGEITRRILDAIRTSEFLVADLTGERPSVYYEVGYAHAIGKRPILYRRTGTRLHFDLAVHNCPEYTNLTDLREKLRRRLAAMTGRE